MIGGIGQPRSFRSTQRQPVVQPPSDYRRALRPPQFTLRALISLITLLAMLFSLVNVVHPLMLSGLVLLALLITGHIAGNAIGTRLREIGSRPVDKDGREVPRPSASWKMRKDEFAPTTELARNASLGWPLLVVTTVGALLGGLGGGVWGFVAAGNVEAGVASGWSGVVVGIVAFAVLGGLGSFATFSFGQVMLGAYWQAIHPPAPRQTKNEPIYPL